MRINFNEMPERRVSGMNGGTGEISAKIYASASGKVIPCRIHPGGSIGLHSHPNSDDINYVISGRGRAFYDGAEEQLTAGVCHICPKGYAHSICNDGSEDLVLLTVVVEH